MSSLGRELVDHTDAIVHRWCEAWRASGQESAAGDAALKDALAAQVRLIGEQLQDLERAEPPERLRTTERARIEPEQDATNGISAGELVRGYALAIDVVRAWMKERSLEVSFDEFSYFCRALFALAAESVAQRARGEQELVRRNRRTYLAAVMHQLRTPLAVVMMAADIAGEEGRLDSSVGAALRRSAHRMRRLVEGVLRLERYRPEEVPLQPREVVAREVVAEIVSDHSRDADRKGLRLEAQVSPSLRITTDPDLFVDALGNLVQDAVKHTERGAVTVEATRETNTVLFRVRNSGSAIDAERLRALLPGARPSMPATAAVGLLIASHAARALGGSINVETEPGRGSMWTFRCPCEIAARDVS